MSGRNETGSLGDQELAILRFIAERAPVTTGEVSLGFGEPNGLARSTIETVMERLRKKGFLERIKEEGAFQYSPTLAQPELMNGLVDQFVQRTLAGSLLPLVTYFSRQDTLSDRELAELERLVAKMRAGQEDK